MRQEYLDIEVDGLTFDGLTWGERDRTPPVLCLHGFPQLCTSWDAVASRLADAGLLVVAFNQRGYAPGARPEAVEAYALPNLVADAIGLIEWQPRSPRGGDPVEEPNKGLLGRLRKSLKRS